ncbi:hypothetical protein O6H91_09G011700 [Diphasiastrum complanatum]|uniref:Uncharacterized protein n=1 Tax=Diphasiastrum complanatum TaxID=34168 RepID=A0ACC2CLF1_DIPCM|nr:hypothetical protein O6H91_09G011700 [Diphasiastrum complanatum]
MAPSDSSLRHYSFGASPSQAPVLTMVRTPSFAQVCGAGAAALPLLYPGCVPGASSAGYSTPLSASGVVPPFAEGSTNGGFARQYDPPDASSPIKPSSIVENLECLESASF